MQRTEIFNVLGWSLGVPQDGNPVDAGAIIARAADHGPEVALAAEALIRWLSQCYHLNQARFLEAAINFPAYNIETDFMLDSILRTEVDSAPESDRGFQCDVMLPSASDLLRAKAADLVSIRDDVGIGYLASVERWSANPTEENRILAQAELRHYCDQICLRYKDINKELVSATFAATSALGMALPVAKAGVSLPLSRFAPFVEIFATVFQMAAIAYQLHQGRTSIKQRTLELTTPREVLGYYE